MLYDINGNEMLPTLPKVKAKVPPMFNSVLSTEQVYTCIPVGQVQSACANGNIIYYADITNKTINAYNVQTQELTSESLSSIGHGNGMTYCDEDNCVYIDVMDEYGTFVKVNADTLAYVGTFHTDEIHSSVAWNRATREFFTKKADGTIYVYDYEWNLLRQFMLGVIPEGTNQAIETDGTFLYFCWLEGTSYQVDNKQHINIYTLDGVFLKDVKPMCSEIESLCYNGYGDYYISNNKGSSGHAVLRKLVQYSAVDPPTSNGTYSLKATVNNGYITYGWA